MVLTITQRFYYHYYVCNTITTVYLLLWKEEVKIIIISNFVCLDRSNNVFCKTKMFDCTIMYRKIYTALQYKYHDFVFLIFRIFYYEIFIQFELKALKQTKKLRRKNYKSANSLSSLYIIQMRKWTFFAMFWRNTLEIRHLYLESLSIFIILVY